MTGWIGSGVRITRRDFRFLAAAVVVCLFVGLDGRPALATGDYAPDLDAWPLVRYWTSADKKERHVEVLGPILQGDSTPERGDFFLRPIYNRRHDKRIQTAESQWFWPLGFGTHRTDVDRQILFPLFLHDKEDLGDGGVRHRNILLPLLFQRSGGGSKADFLLFPLGGVIHDVMGRDKMVIVLWPLFVYQHSRDAASWDFPQPVLRYVKWENGGRGYKVWPLFGINNRPGKLKKIFALWPFFHYQWIKVEQGEMKRWWLFPFYGRISDPRGWEWSALWPFIGQRYEQDVGHQRTTWWFWPLFGRRTGDNVTGWTFRPFYAWERRDPRVEGQFLWPFGWYNALEEKDRHRTAFRFVPLMFIEHEREVRAKGGGLPLPGSADVDVRESGAWQVWPLVKRQWETDGSTRLELPSILPLRRYDPWEWNFAPLFRWMQCDRSPDGVRSYRLLWRLARVDTGPETRYVEVAPLFSAHVQRGAEPRASWSVLKGLLGVEDTPDYRKYRFLYFITLLTNGGTSE